MYNFNKIVGVRKKAFDYLAICYYNDDIANKPINQQFATENNKRGWKREAYWNYQKSR